VDVDTRADIYALGVILFELLTGTTPITRESMKKAALDEMLRLIRDQDAPTPSSRLSTVESAPSVAANRQMEPRSLGRFVKGELDWIVMKALAKERDRRYETASGFARDIERFLNNEVVAAGPPSASYRLRKFVKRNRGQVIAASVVLLALLAGIVGTTWGLVRAERARRDEAAQRRVAEAERHKAEQSEAQAKEERARAESRETQAIDAVKRFRDSVANEPELKNSPRLEGLRKSLLKEPLTFFKDLRDRLQADNDTRPESLLRLAQASFDLGDLTKEIGDQQDALKAYRESLAIHQKLAEAHPTVTEYQRRLGNSYINIADVLRSTGELAAALKAFESASEIFQRLADANPSVAGFRSRLAFSHYRRGSALLVMGRHLESEAEVRQALAL
jgi:eukaryotic-like serine/threonine-protein kinase